MIRHLAVPALLALAPLLAAASPVEVEFVQPEKFSDAGRPFGAERERNLELLRLHLVAEGARRLAPGDTLRVSITDVDLAGSFEPTQRYSNEVRIVRDVYPPRVELDFRVAHADGSVAREGHRKLVEPAFLFSVNNRYGGDALRYEKQLLDDWLEREFKR